MKCNFAAPAVTDRLRQSGFLHFLLNSGDDLLSKLYPASLLHFERLYCRFVDPQGLTGTSRISGLNYHFEARPLHLVSSISIETVLHRLSSASTSTRR